MSHEALSSASGLRPMSAFVVIGAVVVLVAAWVLHFSAAAASQPERLRVERGELPAYAIEDARGRTVARFVPRFDLEMSPRSMWQAHTPRRMAERIAEIVGGEPSGSELLHRMLPDATPDGVITVDAWTLGARPAQRIAAWIASGAESGTGALEGIWLAPDGRGAVRLAWRPEVLLSPEMRERCGTRSAARWARRIAEGLDRALTEPAEGAAPVASAGSRARRDQVWKALLPAAFCRPIEGIPPDRVLALREELERQGVAPWQMKIAYARDRFCPAGEHELFGTWGFADPDQKAERPREGLELLCDRLLAAHAWPGIEVRPETYTWLDDRTVRGERARGYVAFAPGSAPPVVETTLDLGLQRFVARTLAATLDEHDAALALALVADVQTGDVLAVESVERYPVQPFAPVYHVFTTGSTFKVVTMAVALEEGAVRPETRFEVGDGEYRIIGEDGRPTRRVIHEAEGALTGEQSAARLFAFSVNAGLAQIGLRVPDACFHKYLVELGYGRPAGSGLGVERAGQLSRLPWKYAYTHASVGFGHEISTTVWQHATALATVIRGGIHRPLRILRAVAQEGRRLELPLDEGRRVFGAGTCEEVRAMMRRGAAEGTGREVRAALEAQAARALGRELAPGELDLGTKTGTAEKVATETCVHLELAERARWERQGLAPTRARVQGLRRLAKPHGRCYTSSIVVFGRASGIEREMRGDRSGLGGDRELMVFVVVEEPRGKERFGSRVAGPAAAAILAEALGLTRNGALPAQDLAAGFGASPLALEIRSEASRPSAAPWMEGL